MDRRVRPRAEAGWNRRRDHAVEVVHRSLRADAHRARRCPHPDFLWHQLLANSFTDTAAAYRDFDAGRFLHAANGGGDALVESLYGDSLFSGTYVAERWAHLLSLVRFEDKPNQLPQAAFVLQKAWRPAQHEERIDALEREITDIRASESWRIGHAALAPVRLVRRFRSRVSR